jgi:hypothetical protein
VSFDANIGSGLRRVADRLDGARQDAAVGDDELMIVHDECPPERALA